LLLQRFVRVSRMLDRPRMKCCILLICCKMNLGWLNPMLDRLIFL
jgi:hypothetical protein